MDNEKGDLNRAHAVQWKLRIGYHQICADTAASRLAIKIFAKSNNAATDPVTGSEPPAKCGIF
jgi:hypothetical protein